MSLVNFNDFDAFMTFLRLQIHDYDIYVLPQHIAQSLVRRVLSC